jgi:hypothetical protein
MVIMNLNQLKSTYENSFCNSPSSTKQIPMLSAQISETNFNHKKQTRMNKMYSTLRVGKFAMAFLMSIAFSVISLQKANAQVTVTGADATTNAGSPYATVKAAFDNINLSSQAGNTIAISITGNTTETASAVLNQSSGAWTSLTISPSGGTFSISGSVAGPLVSLNGADNVSINGLNDGTNTLTISNTNTTVSACAVRIGSDALLNTITNCNLYGSSIFRTSAVLVIANSTTSAGNTGTISNNNIGSAAASSGNPTNAIYSNNATASSFNTFTLSGNKIFNNFNKDSVNVGVLLTATGNTGWTITNNKLYQTATRVYTTAAAHRGISVLGGSSYTITGNTIGFANASGTGTTNMIGNTVTLSGFPSAYTTTGTANATTYIALNCAFTAGGTVSSIQNNTIAGFAMFTSSGTTSTTSGAFAAIAVTSGSANIGTTTGNTIGATSGQGSIYLASTAAGATVVGIYATSANAISIQNNTIGAIDVSGTSATAAASFAGINANTNAGNVTISNNTIGNSTANNIRTGYLLTGSSLSNAATTPTTATGASSCIGINNLTSTGNVIVLSSNTFRGWQISGTVTTTGGIVSTGVMTGTTPSINANSNAFGTAGLGWVTYVFANTGTITGLSVTNTIATTHNIQNNDFRGINYLSATAGSQAQNYIVCTGGSALDNITTISGNTFSNLNVNSTGTVTFINMGASNITATAAKVCTNNSIVTGFTRASTAASGSMILITDNGSSSIPSTVTNNNFSNITVSGTSTITGINLTDGGTGTIKTITGNTLSNWTVGTGTVNAFNITYWNGVSSLANNIIYNIAGQGAITGITIGSSANNATSVAINNNAIRRLISSGTGGNVTGITCANTSALINIYSNTIDSLSSTGASSTVVGITVIGATDTRVYSNTISNLFTLGTTAPLVNGVSATGGTLVSFYQNKITGLKALSLVNRGQTTDIAFNSAAVVNGALFSGGTTVNFYNNLIGALTADSTASKDAIRGISVTSSTATTSYNVYNNTVYLTASSLNGLGSFGTSGIYHLANATATTAKLDLRNNIIINLSTPGGAGLTRVVAFRRGGSSLANLAATSNNNFYYAGSGGNNLIMSDTTNSYTTFSDYATAVGSTREAFSFTDPSFTYATAGSFFQSVTSSDANYLQPVNGITTRAESGASGLPNTLTNYNMDFSGTTRGGTPDVGAWEFNGVTPAPAISVVSNYVTGTTTNGSGTQCNAVARDITINATTPIGTIDSVFITYNVGAGNVTAAMANAGAGNYTYTIPVANPVYNTVTWSVTAWNSIPLATAYSGTSYTDAPLYFTSAVASASATSICSAANLTLTGSLDAPKIVTAGSASFSSSIPYIAPFSTYSFQYWTQYLFTASDLNALGLKAGKITQLSLNVASPGTTSVTGWSVSMTSLPSTTTTFSSTTFTTANLRNVIPTVATLSLTSGWNDFPFTTQFDWDGVSTVLVDIRGTGLNNFGTNSPTGWYYSNSTSQTLYAYNTGTTNTSYWTTTTTGSATTSKPNFRFKGNSNGAFTSIVWKDQSNNVVGSGSPLTINPTNTPTGSNPFNNTYTASITSSACPISASTASVKINSLPTAPNGDATQQAQCGTPVYVFTGSTFGVPKYSYWTAATGGALAGTSQTGTFSYLSYTADVFNTLYVSLTDTTSGCVSDRTASVDVYASTPDVFTISQTGTVNSCQNRIETLSVTSTVASYDSYTWAPTTNLYTNAAATTPYTGGNATTVYYKRSTSVASETITASAANSITTCSNGASVTFAVSANPTVSFATASPAALCSGSSVSLDGNTYPTTSPTYTAPPAVTNATTDEDLGNVTITKGGVTLLNNTTAQNAQTGTLGPVTSGTSGSYSNWTGYAPVVLIPGQLYNFSLSSVQASGGTYSNSMAIYIDYNRDGTYDPVTEKVYAATATIAGNHTETGSFTVPLTASAGACRMRVMCNEGLITSPTQTLSYGEYEEYAIVITDGVNYNFSWSAGAGSIANTNTTSVVTSNPTPGASNASVVYTLTATNPTTTCSGSLAASAVTVYAPPVAPTNTTTAAQCGTPTYSVTASGLSGKVTYKWYTTANGATPLVTTVDSTLGASSYVYTAYTAGTTNTLYVSLTGTTGCESGRTQIDVAVTNPPTLVVSLSDTNQTCVNRIETLDVTTGATSFTSFVWSPTTNLYTDAAATVAYNGTGNPTTVYYKRSTIVTTEAITLTAVNGPCNASAVKVFKVGYNPVIATAVAAPGTICPNATVSLVANSYKQITGGTAPTYTAPPAVTNATTDEDLGTVKIWKGADTVLKNVSVYNSLSSTIGTATGTAGSYSNFTAFGPYQLVAGQTYNFSLSSYQSTTAYTNSMAIYIDYNRDGVFDATTEKAYAAAATTSGAHTETGTFTVPNDVNAGLCRMRVISNEGLITSSTQSVSYGEYEEYTIQLVSASGLGFTWTATGQTGTVATGYATTATSYNVGSTNASVVYTVKATDSATGCYTTLAATAITVTAPPALPTNTSIATQCGTPTFTASNAITGAIYKWYNVASGGTALQSSTTADYLYLGYTPGATNSLWVSVVDPATGCESYRTQCDVVVNTPDILTITPTNANVCGNTINQIAVSAGTGSYTTYTWTPTTNLYTDAAATVAYNGTGNPTTVYYKRSSASASDSIKLVATYAGSGATCTNNAYSIFTVGAVPFIPTTITATPSNVCSGSTTILTTNSSGSGIGGGGSAPTGYCSTTNSGGSVVTNVVLNAMTWSSTGAPSPFYHYNTPTDNSNTTLLTPGATYNVTVTTNGTGSASVWIDFNRDGIYTADEWVQPYGISSSLSTGTVQITIPANASVGATGMRIRSRTSGSANGATDACTVFGSGSTEDFIVTIDQANTYTWTNGVSDLSTDNPYTTPVLTNNTTAPIVNNYYVRVTNVANCSSTSSALAVTVNPIPTVTDNGTNALQCGTPTYLFTSNVAGVKFKLYNVASGGVAFDSTTSNSYVFSGYNNTASVNDLWVSATGTTGCEGARTLISVNRQAPPTLVVSQLDTIQTCVNKIETLSITTGASSFTNFVWSPTTNLYTDAAATVAYNGTGNPTTVYYKRSTSIATEAITLSASDGVCNASSIKVFKVGANPIISSVIASPATLCSGSTVTLGAASIVATSSVATVGAGTTTTSTYNAPFYSLWSNKKMQYLIKASELTAANLVTGNITSISFPTTSGTVANLDYSIKLAHTTATDLASSFATGTFTTVYTAASQAQAVGNNSLTLSTPFNWDGTSNLLVELCWGNSASTATLSSTSPADATSFVSVRGQYNTVNTSGTSVCSAGGTTTVSYSVRPQIKFGGQVGTNFASDYTWNWTATGQVGSVATGVSTTAAASNAGSTAASVVYTATATASTGCFTTANATAITVNALPTAPTSAATIANQCGTPVYVVSSTVGAPIYKFYDSATGGNLLQSGSNNTYVKSNFVVGVNSVWVTVTDGNTCESNRTKVDVTSSSAPTLTLSTSTNTICSGVIKSLSVTSTLSDYDTYVWSPSTNLYTDAAATVAYNGTGNPTTVYYKRSTTSSVSDTITLAASQSTGTLCVSTATSKFTTNPNPVVSSATVTPTSACSGSSVTLSGASVVGANTYTGSWSWSWSDGTSTVGSFASTSTVVTNNGVTPITKTYTATATNAGTGCFSSLAAPTVTINPVPTAPLSSTVAAQCGLPVYTASSNITGTTFKWYTVATAGTAIATTTTGSYAYTGYTAGVTNTLYVSAISGTCEGPRTAISVVVSAAPAITFSNSGAQNSCVDRIVTLSLTSAAGNYNSYVWSPATNLYTDAAATVAYDGTSSVTTVYHKRNSVTTSAEVITITGTNAGGGCSNFATSTITVYSNPQITTATASPTTVCSGGSVNLTAVSFPNVVGIGDIGTSTALTTATSGIIPYNSNWEGSRVQYLVRASEMTAAGFAAGNISSLAFNVTALGAGTVAQSGFTIKMAHTAVTAMSGTGYATPTGSFSTVYGPATVGLPAIGYNTFNFSSSFNWDGVSNILLDICHDNDINGTCATCYSSSSTVAYTATTYNSTYGSYGDNVQSCGVTATSLATTFTNRPNMRFGGVIGTNFTSSLSWSWSNGSSTVLSTATGTNAPINNGTTSTNVTYSVTATDARTCSTTTNVTTGVVTVNPATVGGTPSSLIVCSGFQPSNDINLVGSVGNVVRWEKSTDITFATGVTNIANTTTTLTAAEVGTVSSITYVRALLQSGICTQAYSNIGTLTPVVTVAGSASSQTVCVTGVGTAPSNNVVLAGYQGVVVKWQKSIDASFTTGVVDIASTSTSLPGSLVGAINATTYVRALVQNSTCSQLYSSNGTLTTYDGSASTISISTNISPICSGSNTVFTAVASNPGVTPVYQWKRNGNVVGTNSSTLAFSSNTLSTGDVIVCTVTSSNPCALPAIATSNTLTLSVTPSPAVGPIYRRASTAITAASLCSFSDTLFVLNYTGGNTVWTSSNTNVATITTVTNSPRNAYIIPVGRGASNIVYTLITAGCASTASFQLKVAPVVTPAAIITQSGGSTVCAGSTLQLISTSAPSGSTGAWTIATGSTWAKVSNTGLLTGTNAGTPAIRYTISNDSGCSSSTQRTITVNAIPSVPSITYAPGTVGNPQAGAPTGAFCVGKKFSVVGVPTGGHWTYSTNGVTTVFDSLVSANNWWGTVKVLGIGTGSIKYTYTNSIGCSNSRTMSGNGVICASRGVDINSDVTKPVFDFTLYPNPAKGRVSFNIDFVEAGGRVVLTDMYGKQVKSQSLTIGTNQVDINSLSKGFYLVSVITNDGSRTTKKLIVE